VSSTTQSPNWAVSAEGLAARIIVSFLATAGIFYVDVMPALIDALSAANQATRQEAGIIGSANMYGGACGSVILALSHRRVRWFELSNRLLPMLIVLDGLSLFVQDVYWLAPLRFLHGIVGGALVGVSYLVVAGIPLPSRTFGMTIGLQVLLGTVAIATVPMLVRAHGIGVIFGAMCCFSLLTWALIQLLPRHVIRVSPRPEQSTAARDRARPSLAALAAISLFQAGNMALFAFEVGLGQSLGHDIPFISRSLGLSGLVSLIGPSLVVLMPSRLRIRWPLQIALTATVIGVALLLTAHSVHIWLAANFLWGVAWNAGLPMLFGLNTTLAPGGSGPVWAAFTSKIGLASGPLIGGIVLSAHPFAVLTMVATALLIAALLAAVVALWMRGADTAQ
jgi:predicted MFS family arabinose efflux permease